MRLKLFFALTALLVLSMGTVSAQENSITLDSVAGLYQGDPTKLETDVPITFYLRLSNAGGTNEGNIVGASNGFRIYSPDGATWEPITHVPYWDLEVCFCVVVLYPGWDSPPNFNDNIFINPYGVTGSGADTIGFGGNSKFPSPGVLPGFSEQVYSISTQVNDAQHGKTLCIDSTFYPPGGEWVWSVDTGVFGEVKPSWDGPHCFTIVDPDAPTGANLGVSETTVTFNAVEGTGNQTFDLTVTSDGDPLDYTVSEAAVWLSVSPTSGTTDANPTVTLTVNPTAAGVGNHTTDLTFNSATALNTPVVVTVNFNVVEELAFDCPPTPIDTNVCQTGQICIDLPLHGDANLGVGVSSGTGTWVDGQLCFNVDTSGTYINVVEADALTPVLQSDQCIVTVNVTIGEAPFIACPLDPLNMQLPAPGEYCFADVGINGATDTSLVGDGYSLVDGQICFTADTIGLYTVTLIATNDCGADTCGYAFDIDFDRTLAVTPTELNFSVVSGGGPSASQWVNINELNGFPLDFTMGGDSSWINVGPFNGAAPDSAAVSVQPGTRSPETYTGHITIEAAATNSPVVIPVTMTVTAAPRTLVVSADTIEFTAQEGSGYTDQSKFDITELDANVIPFTVTAPELAWISLDYVGTETPDSAVVAVAVGDLAPDVYYADITVASTEAQNSPQIVTVKFTVTEAPKFIAAAPDTLYFSALDGTIAVDPKQFSIDEVGGAAVPYTLDLDLAVDWVYLEKTSGTTPDMVYAGPSALDQGPGDYYATVFVNSTETENYDSVVIALSIFPIEVSAVDSITIEKVPAVPGATVNVPIMAVNQDGCSLQSVSGSFEYTSPYLTLNGATFVGTAVETWEIQDFHITGMTGNFAALADTATLIPPFTKVAVLYAEFTVAADAPDGFLPIDFVLPSPQFGKDCGPIVVPTQINGGIMVEAEPNYACGYTVDPDGAAVPFATVELWSDFPYDGKEMTVTSDETGFFEFIDFESIPYDVYGYKEGYYPDIIEDKDFGDTDLMVVLEPMATPAPTPEWVNFYCNDNLFMGAPLPVGSVIDAFDPDGVHCGTFWVSTAGQYGFLAVYRDDPFSTDFDEGAEPGDLIRFYVNGMEAITSGMNTWTENGASFEACLDAGQLVTHECNLVEGWNLVSWPVDQPSDYIKDALASISDCIEVVLGFEQGALTYDPLLEDFSTLWYVDHLSGYWIKMNCAATLSIEGNAVPVTTPIPLTTGWNLVSYLPEFSQSLPLVLQSISDELLVAQGFDAVGMTYQPTTPDHNTLLEMAPCFGYWIKVSTDATLVYNNDLPLATAVAPQVDHMRIAAKNTGSVVPSTRWVDVYSRYATLDGRTITAGSTVKAISENGTTVGYFRLEESGKFGFMPVYADDPSQAVSGLQPGDRFSLNVNGVETNETFVWTTTGDRIEVGQLSSKGTGSPELPDAYSLDQNYPNPFNPETTIRFTLPGAASARVEVFNVLGKLVAVPFDGQASAGANEVRWDGRNLAGESVSSGIYFYRLTADNFSETKKMTLLK